MRAALGFALAGVSIAGLTLTANAAVAAPTKNPPAHPIANTQQTFDQYYRDGSGYTEEVVFTGNTWSLPGYADEGTFTNKGESLTMKTTSAHDRGCTYKGTYVASTTLYTGKLKCPNSGAKGTFTVTTTGQSG